MSGSGTSLRTWVSGPQDIGLFPTPCYILQTGTQETRPYCVAGGEGAPWVLASTLSSPRRPWIGPAERLTRLSPPWPEFGASERKQLAAPPALQPAGKRGSWLLGLPVCPGLGLSFSMFSVRVRLGQPTALSFSNRWRYLELEPGEGGWGSQEGQGGARCRWERL